ncbi:EAL domain-containing protein [uncultured Azohydromonas sp.]|uniref:putative bifunctional diguanylate cyclase/phosphodiesterase n=1 Tax=uncultured Azohydromonas sp. TaxID=487342 RepID=UPI0026067701|nr:EAL domain-containing protein [uncultured Azohydromonas sp.]
MEGAQSANVTIADPERGAMRFGLRAKFIVTVLLILTVTMAANTWYFVHTSTQRQEQQLRERGHALGRLISLISPQAIIAFDYLQLNDYTREVSAQPDVVYGVIVTPKGIPISTYIRGADAATRHQAQAARPDDLVETLRRLGGEADLLSLDFPIVHNDVELGRFLVGLSRGSLHKEIHRQLVTQLLLLAAVVLFLGAAIYTVFRFNVLQPIQKLITASRVVARGEYAVVDVDSTDEFGMLARAFNAMASEVKHKQERLQRQANFDSLTGLPNRMMAFERIGLEVQRAKRQGERFALMFIDLDNFKDVNDSLGHPAGDRLLVDIGARLKDCMRACDTVARLGGDEFLVVVPTFSDEAEIERIAARIAKAVSEPQLLCGRKVVAKCSIGVAIYPDNGESVEALMANADNAMYQAKAVHSGSAMFFTEEMNTRLRERVLLEQGLDAAVEQGQLTLFFQPVHQTRCGRLKGAEVLLRWRHPERGFISPADFVPVAEASGQIVQIGDWVLEQACRCWSAWRSAGIDPGSLAINISSVQFKRNISERLGRLMAAYGIPPHALELELTERVLLEDHKQVAEEFTKLRALGVRLALDDFGTGYSSLSYLKYFRFDLLKIDRSFVAGLPDSLDDASVVKAILAMAAGLDLEVVAEGVETHTQLQFLSAQACDYAQGYLIAKPMDEMSYGKYLQELNAGGAEGAISRLMGGVAARDAISF